MLNSDGEIENQEIAEIQTEDTEVGSSTIQLHSTATWLNKKLHGIVLNTLGKLIHF